MEKGNLEIIKNFNPSWFSVIMGTGIIPVALFLNRNIIPIFYQVAQLFFIISLLLFIIIFIPWIIRFFKYFKNVKSDLMHPVKASFFSTFPISIMILAINFLVVGKSIFGEKISLKIAVYLFAIGSVGILLFGFIILSIIFINNEINLSHANFAWFIPCVSHLFIPIVGFDLVSYFKNSPYAYCLFIISIVGLGIGFIIFIYTACAVYHRYVFHELLTPNLSPTIFIGIVPTALITTICPKITTAVNSITFNKGVDAVLLISKLTGLATWGFSVWWFVISVIVIFYYIVNKKLIYSLSWWAFTFPIGSLAVSTGNINKLYNLAFFDYTLTGFIVLMISVWIIVAFQTLKAVIDNSIFQPS